ncbi:hypothetical protein GCM10020358_72770 [Amorphoplanes nipponensis]|uniref:Uncharacterized protein n=1 Tax=Actinoplanes nipponensis TaxID=135950 RepID=A0A919JI39_9ACTN|nr:hypothetical protein [Actinoplanes nipponensis]GIE49695.1 hypothetical protein Ani05nite_32290 [Actinoplanes nipponensis]
MQRNVRHRLLALAGLLTLLAGCGEPPAPPLTAPPLDGSTGASTSAYPLPSGLTVPAPVPTGILPPATLPTVPYVPPATLPPVATTPPRTTTTTTTPPAPTVSLAPKCRSGPTPAQMLAVLKGLPGIPDRKLAVADGPYCAGSWQFAAVQIAGEDPKEAEQLFVVTTGTPTALKVIEAGTDVCSVEVQSKAPAGIRARACGA